MPRVAGTFDSVWKIGALTLMSLSLHIAQGDARRVAGKKGPVNLPARISALRPHFGLGLVRDLVIEPFKENSR
jgi:hypothetical protein